MATNMKSVPIPPKPSTKNQQSDSDVMVDNILNSMKNLFAGALAGAVSRSVTSPLERLKVMRQVQVSGTKYNGLFRSLMLMYKEEGIRAYWKGNGTNVARIAPYSAIQFLAFDAYKKLLVPAGSKGSVGLTLAAGAMSGMTSSVICYPLDLVRSHLTVQTTTKTYNGMIHGVRSIYAANGFRGLYRGLPISLMGIGPYVAINFTVFDLLKRNFLPAPTHPWFDVISFSFGAAAGFCAAAVTYPSDVIRRRMQLSGSTMHGLNIPKYKSSLDCIQSIIKYEGTRGLYKGMIPCFLKVVPSMAIAFAIHERLRRVLKFDLKDKKK
jgi:solute carrier family 25 (mitochondrial phosphate transporter), member 23/24/25/41